MGLEREEQRVREERRGYVERVTERWWGEEGGSEYSRRGPELALSL